MSAIGWWIVALSAVGAAFEILGILLLSDRGEGLRRRARRVIRGLTPARIRDALASGPATHPVGRDLSILWAQEAPTEPPPATWRDIQEMNRRLIRMETALRTEITERLRTPRLGMGVLIAGALMLLAASILGSLNA